MAKKYTILGVCILLLAGSIYFVPKLMQKQETAKAAKIATDNAAFTTKALEEFELNKNAKPSQIAQNLVNEFNEAKKTQFYTFDKECKNCTAVEYDDDLIMIILTAYNKKGELTSRTVIKPPSFVSYQK